MFQYTLNELVEVTPSMLTPFQVLVLNEALAYHHLPRYTVENVPDNVTYVCLKCGTVGVTDDNRSRDIHVENFDMTCCGLTVVFHSPFTPLALAAVIGASN